MNKLMFFFVVIIILCGVIGCGGRAISVSDKPASIMKYDFPQKARRIEPLPAEPQPNWLEEFAAPMIDKKFLIMPARSARFKTEQQITDNLKKTAVENAIIFLTAIFKNRIKETITDYQKENADYDIISCAAKQFIDDISDTKYWIDRPVIDKIYIEKWQTHIGEIFYNGYAVIKYERAFFDRKFFEAIELTIENNTKIINVEADKKKASRLKAINKQLRKIAKTGITIN